MKKPRHPTPQGDGNGIRIIGIEEKTNTITMNIADCRVTAVFQDRDNREIYGRVKGILIDSIIKKGCAEI